MKIKCQECKSLFDGMPEKEDTCPSCLKKVIHESDIIRDDNGDEVEQ